MYTINGSWLYMELFYGKYITSCISTGVVGLKLISCSFSALVSLNCLTASRNRWITSGLWLLQCVFSRYLRVWSNSVQDFINSNACTISWNNSFQNSLYQFRKSIPQDNAPKVEVHEGKQRATESSKMHFKTDFSFMILRWPFLSWDSLEESLAFQFTKNNILLRIKLHIIPWLLRNVSRWVKPN